MLSDEEKEAIDNMKSLLLYSKEHEYFSPFQEQEIDDMNIVLNIVEKQSKEIERINEILTWKQKHEEQLQKEIEELKEKNEYLPSWVNRKYISKDKIKAKIDYIKNRYNIEEDYVQYKTVVIMLQSLLEKE